MTYEVQPVPYENRILNIAHDTMSQIEQHPVFQGMDESQQAAIIQWVSVGVDAGFNGGQQAAEFTQKPETDRRRALLRSSSRLLNQINQDYQLDAVNINGNPAQTLGQGE